MDMMAVSAYLGDACASFLMVLPLMVMTCSCSAELIPLYHLPCRSLNTAVCYLIYSL